LPPKFARHSPQFAECEGEVAVTAIDRLPLGDDATPDLAFINLKTLDFVGHTYGPNSSQMKAALLEVDQQVMRIVDEVRDKSQGTYVLVVTADHGMPSGDRADPKENWAARRHTADELKKLLNDSTSGPVAVYEGENAQMYVKDTLVTRDAIAALAARLKPRCFAVFTEDAVRAAAARLH